MKYSVEFDIATGIFTETLEIDNHTVRKCWKREYGDISGLCSSDKDFSEQLSELLDEDDCDKIQQFFDDQMLVSDMEDFILASGLE